VNPVALGIQHRAVWFAVNGDALMRPDVRPLGGYVNTGIRVPINNIDKKRIRFMLGFIRIRVHT
jgi:uncharacterized protein YigE (DUF2233 family)